MLQNTECELDTADMAEWTIDDVERIVEMNDYVIDRRAQKPMLSDGSWQINSRLMENKYRTHAELSSNAGNYRCNLQDPSWKMA